MTINDTALRRVEALAGIGWRLARSAPSGRVLLAQLAIGIDPALIPRPWGDDLASELDAARQRALEPLSTRQVEQILRRAWGTRPRDELDDLDPDPAALTPTSQVHRGTLEGSPVAVKVLRPGVARSVGQDLSLLDSLLAPMSAAFPALDARAVMGEVRERVLDELDLEQEGGTQRRFHRALRGHPWLLAPAPVMRLAHADVLVSDWIDGVPLGDAPDRDQAAARLVRFGLGAARTGVMHADLKPDDVLVTPDGRLAVLDYGAWCEVDPVRLRRVIAAVEAFIGGDVDGFTRAVTELGWLPAERAPHAFDLLGHALDGLAGAGPVRLDAEAILTAAGALRDHLDVLIGVLLTGSLPATDLWPARATAQLFGTIARVGATGDWTTLTRQALRDGWGD
ncbi:MAG TPA: AarF/UbiB family protein [Solirubrobacteraceae bacterium]|nr:AarF/UbiB family protein [Solirubrobacteraceae bacterium]